MKRLILPIALVAMGASACATPPTPAPGVTATFSQPTIPSTPTARATPTTAFPSKDVIKIASAGPLSGEQAPLGEGIKFGAQLAIEQLGKPLTDLGFKVQLVPFDDQARTDLAANRAKDIAADPDVLVVIGNLSSDAAIAASDVYKTADLAMIAPAASKPKLTTRGYANVNRTFGRDDVQGPAAAHFITEQLQLKSVYVISDKSDFGQGLSQTFGIEAKKLGLNVLGSDNIDERSPLDATITSLRNARADAVYFTGPFIQGGNLLNQMRAKTVGGTFVATERIDNPEFPRIAGQAAEGIYFASSLVTAATYPDALQFIRDYKAKFNKQVPPYAAQAYDATAIALKAMATLAKDGKPTRKTLAQAIRATQGYTGITGTMSFNSNGDLTSAKYFFVKVTSADPRRWEDNSIFKFVELAPPQ